MQVEWVAPRLPKLPTGDLLKTCGQAGSSAFGQVGNRPPAEVSTNMDANWLTNTLSSSLQEAKAAAERAAAEGAKHVAAAREVAEAQAKADAKAKVLELFGGGGGKGQGCRAKSAAGQVRWRVPALRLR